MGFSLPFFKKKLANDNYFGIYLTDSTVFGFIFGLKNGQAEIIAQNVLNLTSGFEKILEDVDNLISELELKSNIHIDNTIYFLHSWMIDESTFEIKEPYKNIIKNLSKELDLNPLGYIDVKEVLEKFFAKKSIVNTIAIEVNKSKIGVFVYKGGKLVHSMYTPKTSEVGEDISSVFKNMPDDLILPNSIKVYGDEEKVEISSTLATYKWAEKLFRVHPTIEVIKQPELNQSLADTFTNELLLNQSKPDGEKKDSVFAPSCESGSGISGFVIGKDITLESSVSRPDVETEFSENQQARSASSNSMPATKENIFKKLISNLSKFKMGAKSRTLIFLGITLGMFVLVFLLYEYFLHTLHIKIYLKAAPVEKEISLDIPIKETTKDTSALVKKTVEQEFSDKKQTTGVREVGEKATGKVTVYNSDNSERTFPAGTKLSKGDLIFLTDTEIKVAASSGKIVDSKKDVGEKNVSVTAEKIGEEYNIKSSTPLTIENLSDALYVAIAIDDFTGGSKKEVTTVSKKDIDTLEQSLEKQAKSKSTDVLGTKIGPDEELIPDLTEVKIADSKFSGEVGEEATSLSVNAKSKIDYYVINKPELVKKIREELEKGLDSGFEIDVKYINYEIKGVTEKNSNIILKINIDGTASKIVDTNKILGVTSGKNIASLEKTLTDDFEISKVEFEQPFGGKLPFLSFWSPLFGKNITISTGVR